MTRGFDTDRLGRSRWISPVEMARFSPHEEVGTIATHTRSAFGNASLFYVQSWVNQRESRGGIHAT